MVPADAEAHASPVMRAAAVLLSAFHGNDDEYESYARGVLELGATVMYPSMEIGPAVGHFADQLSRYRAMP